MPLRRFVADTVQYDGIVPGTPVDMNEVLESFSNRFRKLSSDALLDTCERYRRGRVLVDDRHRNRIPTGRSLTPLEREELLVAERDMSDLIGDMVAIMFRWYCRSPRSQKDVFLAERYVGRRDFRGLRG
ncbi:hypothetical protein Q1695_014656 [Nippostrongylus brasiliensis]|nr:hypothetical protein Q1695_014656 [Nippostrongylus brasiliensis]